MDKLVKIFKIAVNVVWVAILLYTLVILVQQNASIWQIIFVIGLGGLISKLFINHITKIFVEKVSLIPHKK